MLAPSRLLCLRRGGLSVTIAPEAGGRIAQIVCDGVEWLQGYDGVQHTSAIGWGSYPMVPWAGRIRSGRFSFLGRSWQLPPNLGGHAIHGVGFQLPWRRVTQSARDAELALELPTDTRWPFGGYARQRFELGPRRLRQWLTITAGKVPMPVVIGWHPWLRKPDTVEFAPTAMYPRDADGMATVPTCAPQPAPWDDCFINTEPVIVTRGEQTLRLRSDCDHWVVYDQPAHATCIEPQTGPPDGFTLAPYVLAPGRPLTAWFEWSWN